MTTKTFEELTYTERSFYFEWMEMLIQDGQIPEDIPQEEFMAKINRMVKCDQNQQHLTDGWPMIDGTNFIK